MMYVYARYDIDAGSEIFTRYFDVDYNIPRTFGLPGEGRYFVCSCSECKAWAVQRRKVSGIKAVLDAKSVKDIEVACLISSIDIEKGLDPQTTNILRGPIFRLAQSWISRKPRTSMVAFIRLLAALQKFDPTMETAIQTHLAIAENALFLSNMELAKKNLKGAFIAFQRVFKGTRAQFITDFAPQLSVYPREVLP